VTPAETLQRHVALEFKVPCSALTSECRQRDIVLARHVWWYLVAMLPQPTAYPKKDGMRPRRDSDGPLSALARLADRDRRSIRYGLGHVEDLRDDADFDARVSRLEALIETP